MLDPTGRAAERGAGAGSPGLLDSLRELAGTVVAAAQTRLDLLSADTQEAGWRVAAILLYAVVALFCLFVGTVLLALLAIVAFWDRSPALAVGILSGLFLVGGGICAVVARRYARTGPRLFATTIDALAQDRAALASGKSTGPRPTAGLDRVQTR